MKINSFSANSLLYYPTIEFQNETWVKAALTFWDEIYRIVPSNYIVNDSDEIKIAVKEGFIKNIELNEADLSLTAKEFMDFCDTLKFYPDGFETSPYQIKIHENKIDSRLKPFFNDFSRDFTNDGFYVIPQELANGYMFFLSNTISKRRNIPKLTDNPDLFAAMSYFDVEGNFDELLYNDKSSEIYTNLMIENLIPADIESIAMSNILERSRSLINNKREFREIVSTFAEKINKIKDTTFAISEIEKFKLDLQGNQATRKEILSHFSANLRPSLLYVGFPTFLATMIKTLFSSGDVYDFETIMSGLFISGIASISRSGIKVSKLWNGNKSNYYLILKKT